MNIILGRVKNTTLLCSGNVSVDDTCPYRDDEASPPLSQGVDTTITSCLAPAVSGVLCVRPDRSFTSELQVLQTVHAKL